MSSNGILHGYQKNKKRAKKKEANDASENGEKNTGNLQEEKTLSYTYLYPQRWSQKTKKRGKEKGVVCLGKV